MFDRCSGGEVARRRSTWRSRRPWSACRPPQLSMYLPFCSRGPVDEVQVHVVQAEPFEAGLDGVLGRLEALVLGGQLGGDEQVVARDARCGDGPADRLLVAVGRGGVDQPVADFQRCGDRAFGLGSGDNSATPRPSTGMVLSSLSVTVGIAAADVMSPTCEVEVCPGRAPVGTARCPDRGSPTPDDDSTQRHMPSEQGGAGVEGPKKFVTIVNEGSAAGRPMLRRRRVVVRCGHDSDGEQRTAARSADGEGAPGGEQGRDQGDPASARRAQAPALRRPGDHDRRQHPGPVDPDDAGGSTRDRGQRPGRR